MSIKYQRKRSNSNSNNSSSSSSNGGYNNMMIQFEGKKPLSFKYNINDFKLSDVDTVIRSYHGLVSSDRLEYHNKENDLIIPSSSMKDDIIYVRHVKEEVKLPKITTIEDTLLKFLISYGAAILIILTTLTFAIEKSYINSKLDDVLMLFGIAEQRKVIIEAWIAFLCWSTSNLFIRRLLNPETMRSAYLKYSADAFFGGLGQSVSVFLKVWLQKALN